MPRIGDLQNCKIYKLVSMNNSEMVYYGHTCQTLAQRFAQHTSKSNKTSSKNIIEKGDAIILLVEHFPCLNENEARAREGFYILNNPCVNRCVAGRTDKQYYIDKKEILVEYQKNMILNIKNKLKIE
jgi:predicted GIY-YIG superfamily endonuclease